MNIDEGPDVNDEATVDALAEDARRILEEKREAQRLIEAARPLRGLPRWFPLNRAWKAANNDY
ncbi:hypothetical protein HC928_01330 [bacterium]|nr:hypothetical protein [bacterium]